MAEENKEEKPKKEKKPMDPKMKQWLMWLLAVVLLFGFAYAGYYWGDKKADEKASQQASQKDEEIKKLQEEKEALEKQLEEEKAKSKASKSTADESTPPSEADLENIQAAINTMNTAALEGLMADTVTVIYAASEGLGPVTPAEAVAALDYFSAATAPWDWELPAAELAGYAAGFYSDYFPDDALVGKSSDNYLVSFSFDSSGDISTIFITGSTSIL